MPEHDGNQPDLNPSKETHREYIPATWKPLGAGGGAPKLDGGITINTHTGEEAPRAFNRPGQKYEQSAVVLSANRVTRAAAELASSVILQADLGRCQVTTASGNTYFCTSETASCNCPDRIRLDDSGRGNVACKHELIAGLAITAAGSYDDLDWSAVKLAEYIGVELRTAERLCEKGTCSATKALGKWVIAPGDGEAAASSYQENMWPW